MRIGIEEIINRSGELLIMPSVARKVIGLVSQMGTTAKELATVLIADQAITARLLRMVNSPFYGVGKKVTKVSEAVVLLGFDAVKSLVLTVSIKNTCKTPGVAEKLMWEHSIGVAVASAYIAKQLQIPKYEELFIAGLLHDVGRVPIYKVISGEYNELLKNLSTYSDITNKEKEKFGFTHADIGGKIVDSWNLPEELEEIIKNHHSFNEPIPDDIKDKKAVAIISLANKICWKLKIGFDSPIEEINMGELLELKELELPSNFFDSHSPEIIKDYEGEKQLFED